MNLFRSDLGAYYAMMGADPDFVDGDLPFDAIGPDPDAENDPSLRDLDTVCAWCGLEHHKESLRRDCPCKRHIDGGAEVNGKASSYACNAAPPELPTLEAPADVR